MIANMTTEERLKGNELIARYEKRMLPSSCIEDYIHGLPVNTNRRYLHYHRSWNELMPVVKKCLDNFHDHRGDIYSALHECDIAKTWSAVIVYISWLQANKEEVDCFQKYKMVYWNDKTKKCEADKYIGK